VSNGDGVSGNPTIALANDLAALEGLSSTGLIARTGDGTAEARTITATAGGGVGVTNGSGVSGNPTLTLSDSGMAAVTAFNSGDKIVVFEGGTPKLADFDDLPGAGGGISNVVEDASPALGGDLETNGSDIIVQNGDRIRSGTTAGHSYTLTARNTGGGTDTAFITFTAHATAPTCDLSAAVTAGSNPITAFPSGTLMLFQQTAAPTGWTKETTHDDKALRVVTGAVSSGGTSAFSTVFGKSATDSHTLTTSQIPAHTHTLNNATVVFRNTGGGAVDTSTGGSQSTATISANNEGGGTGHTHSMDIRVQYVDLIIASKD
jgi:hypothetical protein